MLYPIMEPKRPSAERKLVVPPASGTTALRLPDPDDLPPPYVDSRLVRPETREEMVDELLIEALPANPEHGDEHTEIDFLGRGYVAPNHTTSTDLLTRTDQGSDFATDLSIRRSGIDPRTGSRYLEELAFEIVNEQSVGHMVTRARKLSARGVRRIFAIFVKTREVCEWSPTDDLFIVLEVDDAIEDRTLIRPLPIRALFDAAVADVAVARALKAKGNPVFAEARAEGLAEGIEAVCDLLGLPFGPRELEALQTMDAPARAALLAHLRTERRWPTSTS